MKAKKIIVGLLLFSILAPMGFTETSTGVTFPFGIDPFASKETILEGQAERFGEFSELSSSDPTVLYSASPQNIEVYGMQLGLVWLWLQDEAPALTSVLLHLQGDSPSDLETLCSEIVGLYGEPVACIQANPDYDINGNVINHSLEALVEKGKAAIGSANSYSFYASWITQYPDRIIWFSIDASCGGEQSLTVDLRWGFMSEEEYVQWIEEINP